MFRNFWLGAFRNLWRNKINTLINIASLCLGLTVFSFALLYVRREFSHDSSWPDADRILRLVLEQHGLPIGRDGVSDTVNASIYPKFAEYFPSEIDKISRVSYTFVKPADQVANFGYNLGFADPAFADIFNLDIVEGSMEVVLGSPGLLAVEESFAKNFPGGVKLGNLITFQGGNPKSGRIDFRIGAIFRNRADISSSVRFSLIAGIGDYVKPLMAEGPLPWEASTKLWLKLKPGIALKQFNAVLPDFIDKEVAADNVGLKPGERISEHLAYRFQPVTDLYFHPINTERGGDMARVLTFAAVGLLVLLVGCSNSISLSMASTWERRREIGIRKAIGATRRDVVAQFLGESVLLAMLALLPSIVLVELLLPLFNTQMNIPKQYALALGSANALLLFLIAILVGLVNGAYPAIVLAVTRPVQVLRVETGGTNKGLPSVRMLLVAFQFGFATMLLIATLALYAQLKVAHGQPLGFDMSNTLIVSINGPSQADRATAELQDLRKLPGVTLAIPVFQTPGYTFFSQAQKIYSKEKEIREAEAKPSSIYYDFFSMFKIPVLAGRVHDPAHDHREKNSAGQYTDQSSGSAFVQKVMINRSAMRVLGFSSPEDALDRQIFQKYKDQKGVDHEIAMLVIGVVEDSMYGSLKSKPGPEFYTLMDDNLVLSVAIKYQPSFAATIEQSVKDSWTRVVGSPPGNIQFGESVVANAFREEESESRLLLSCAGLALFLSAIGLYGLAAFTMARRTKEVGVRKVMGAGIDSITYLFLWRYARPVLLVNVVAWPVALYFVLQWLQRFPYQLEKVWLLPLCMAASVLALLIAMLAVAGVVLRAARQKPVLALRYE